MSSQFKKHIIFLGAGASRGSGYPLANGLRLLMSSSHHLEKAITDYEEKHKLKERPIWREAESCLRRHEKALDLFRNGGFATLDEFCKLASGQFPAEINGLRRIVRAILGTFNPEEAFEKSEYYGFVQSLFKDDLVSLRDDVTVLTYNYDPYLEFILYRALEHRWRIKSGRIDRDNILNAATSGFHLPDSQQWLKEVQGFCVLKLHGSMSYANEDPRGFHSLFRGSPAHRGQNLFAYGGDKITPPILFPWEVMTESGLIDESSFPLQRDCLYSQNGILHSLFRGIWERARREVQAAEKISFIGLSMHPFIFDGLKYLFSEKAGTIEVVIANPENIVFDRNRRETHWSRDPQSLGSAVSTVLSSCAPKMKYKGSLPGSPPTSDGEITLIRDFAGFIKTQMKPVPKEF